MRSIDDDQRGSATVGAQGSIKTAIVFARGTIAVIMSTRSVGIPAALARRPLAMVSSATAEDVYAHPRAQLARLERNGLLHKVAPGVYAIVPRERLGDPNWLPTLEGVAFGVGALEFGVRDTALLGLSAARLHRAVPRALATAVVGVPARKDKVRLTDRSAVVSFAVRNIDELDVETMPTDVGTCLVTTPEQTVLDLAHRPTMGGGSDAQAWEAIRALLPRCDRTVLERIAATRRRARALAAIDRDEQQP